MKKEQIITAINSCNNLAQLRATYDDLMKRQNEMFNQGNITVKRLIALDSWTCDTYSTREDEIRSRNQS